MHSFPDRGRESVSFISSVTTVTDFNTQQRCSIVKDKMTMAQIVFFFAILTVLNLIEVSAQTTGDVRLVGQTNPNLGRLEIYWKGRWSTFCGANKNSFTMGAAQAACRQLGYLDAFRFDTVS